MRLKLFLSFVLIVVVSVVLVTWIARQGAVGEVRAFMYRGGMTGTDGLAGELEDYYRQNGSWQGVEALLDSPGHGQGMMGGGNGQGMMGQRLRIADRDGKIVADSSTAAPTGEMTAGERDASIELKVDDQVVGYLLPEGGMGFNRGDEQFLVARLNRAALIAGLIALVVALFLAFFLAYRLLRPVRDLASAAQNLAQGDLSQRVPVSGNDELAHLGRDFNQMADALQQAGESRRAMTADIAHELRTPLAVQRANLEALQDGVYPLSPENLQPILDQNLLLSRLVDDLRTLALADAGQLTLERVPTDLPGLAGRVVERFQAQAADQQVTLRYTPPQEAWQEILLDPLRIEQILNNLISNALRYTPAGGQVLVTLRKEARRILLEVRDSGPGIPAEALPHVFERFYRADRSRARSQGGSGLGLAIARQLARAHSGELKAANAAPGGALFTLELPVN
jgi:signal transduction histidine kinase